MCGTDYYQVISGNMCGTDENMAITAENRVKNYQVPSFIVMVG
jgi:hypothetical protein